MLRMGLFIFKKSLNYLGFLKYMFYEFTPVKRLSAVLIFFILVSIHAKADSVVSELNHRIEYSKVDTIKVNLLFELASHIELRSPDSALIYYKKIIDLLPKAISQYTSDSSIYRRLNFVLAETYKHMALIHTNNYKSMDLITSNYYSAIKHYKQAGYIRGIGICFNNLGLAHMNTGNYNEAMYFYRNAMEIFTYSKDNLRLAAVYTNLGVLEHNLSRSDMAIVYYSKALKLYKQLNSKMGIAYCYGNIGLIYQEMADQSLAFKNVKQAKKEYHKAAQYLKETLMLNFEIGDNNGINACLNNLGNVYDKKAHCDLLEKDTINAQKVFDESISIYKKALEKNKMSNNQFGASASYNNIGDIFKYRAFISTESNKSLSLLDSAEYFFINSLKIKQVIDDKKGMALVNRNLAEVYYYRADMTDASENSNYRKSLLLKALEYGENAYAFASKINSIQRLLPIIEVLRDIYAELGQFKQALKYADIMISIQDSNYSKEKTQALANAERRFEAERKQLVIQKLNKDNEIKNLELIKNRELAEKQRVILFFIFVVMAMMAIFIYSTLKRFRIIRNQNKIIEEQKLIVEEKNLMLMQQNEEIGVQRDSLKLLNNDLELQKFEITKQRDMLIQKNLQIDKQKKSMTDSMNYARRIQNAMLPSVKEAPFFDEHSFVYFQPKDIVSGDFYWVSQINDYVIFAVADCTGHGVPGAFMSVLGIAALNEIILKKEILNTNLVLDELRNAVIEALKQQGTSVVQKDGMDITLCIYHTSTRRLQFSTANSTFFVVSSSSQIEHYEDRFVSGNSYLYQFRTDIQTIAIAEEMFPFKMYEIVLNEGDMIYLFSDGYQDQFGGRYNRKIGIKMLRELLMDISKFTIEKQNQIIQETFFNHKGELNQIDDVTLMGIRI